MTVATTLLDKGEYTTATLLLNLLYLLAQVISAPVGEAYLRLEANEPLLRRSNALIYQALLVILCASATITIAAALAINSQLQITSIPYPGILTMSLLFLCLLSSTQKSLWMMIYQTEFNSRAIAIAVLIESSILIMSTTGLLMIYATSDSFIVATLTSLIPFLALTGFNIQRRGFRTTTEVMSNRTFSDKSKAIIHYGWPLSVMALVAWCHGLTDRFILAAEIGVEQVAPFIATHALLSRIVTAPNQLGALLFRAKIYSGTLEERIYKRYWLVFYTIVTAPISISLCLNPETILGLLLPQDYIISSKVTISLLIAGFTLTNLSQILEQRLFIQKQTYLLLYFKSSTAMISVLLNVCMIPAYGIMGAALSSILANTLYLFFVIFASGQKQ